MRMIALLAAALVLGGCATQKSKMVASMIGAGNAAALEAAAACNFDEALRLSQHEAGSERPEIQLFSQFTQAAIYSETGQAAKASAAVERAFTDPAMNPRDTSRQEMQDGANAVQDMIRGRREETTGSPDC
ncbi:MAG: hypothetical protein KDA50_07915 [Rhodobacteraceae bacterium]|nr:hypothetical protein [Paracoccaceae bacterium]